MFFGAHFSAGDDEAVSFGHAPLDDQPPHERQYAPYPGPDGTLAQDPEFLLETTAGALPWRLYYQSWRAMQDGPWSYGRRASWSLRLCGHLSGGVTTIALEREDGTLARYSNASGSFVPLTPRVF